MIVFEGMLLGCVVQYLQNTPLFWACPSLFSIATNEGFLHDAFLDHFSIPEDNPIGHLIVENSILGCQTSTNNPVAVELWGTRKRSEIATKMGLTNYSKKEHASFINL